MLLSLVKPSQFILFSFIFKLSSVISASLESNLHDAFVQETQKQMTQREAATAAQRHSTSKEIESIASQLRGLQSTLASQEPESGQLQGLRSDLNSAQETITGLHHEIAKLNQQYSGSLEGVQALAKDIEKQLTEVCPSVVDA